MDLEETSVSIDFQLDPLLRGDLTIKISHFSDSILQLTFGQTFYWEVKFPPGITMVCKADYIDKIDYYPHLFEFSVLLIQRSKKVQK